MQHSPTRSATARLRAKGWVAAICLAVPLAASAQYSQHNLVSDGFVTADHTDAQLINPWGISFTPTSPFWVSDQGSSAATLYNGSGTKQALVVTTPFGPTGTVFNGTTDFVISNGTTSAASVFLFATLSGQIVGWNPTVGATTAINGANLSSSGAVYTGLAKQGGVDNRLYAANFGRGAVDMFNGTFGYTGSFTDSTVDVGYSPFNVQSIGSSVFVEYALVGANGRQATGAGLGFVDEFDRDGHLIRRFASHGALNAPWGVALAPASFGAFGGDLLIGNFGDGRINAFDPTTGAFIGALSDAGGSPIENVGLWGLAFGNNAVGTDPNSLYFTAGIGNELHGLFGRISVVPEPASMAALSFGVVSILRRRRRR